MPEGINKRTGRLKKGYHFGKGGKVVKAKPKKRTPLFPHAAKLGSAGGKVTAKKRRQPQLF